MATTKTTVVKKRTPKFTTFTVGVEPTRTGVIKFIQITDSDLSQALYHILKERRFYHCNEKADYSFFFQKYFILQNAMEEWDILEELVGFLTTEFADSIKRIQAMLDDGLVEFESLSFYFKEGDEVVFEEEGVFGGGIVKNVQYYSSWFGTSFKIAVESIRSNGKALVSATRQITIPSFNNMKRVDELNIVKITPELKTRLTERGKFYEKIVARPSYLKITGNIYQRSWWGLQAYKAAGRCMVDIINYDRCNPNAYSNWDDDNNDEQLIQLNESNYWMTTPWTKAFSFTCKKWGEVKVDELFDIEFQDNSFDQLVMEQNRKNLVLSLVKNTDKTFSDIISGKGGGCIFLLYGPPGVGKTLTAESVAELLHRPLYSITVGEGPYEYKNLLSMLEMWNPTKDVLMNAEFEIIEPPLSDAQLIDRWTARLKRLRASGHIIACDELSRAVAELSTRRLIVLVDNP
jgi:hypothetical protein